MQLKGEKAAIGKPFNAWVGSGTTGQLLYVSLTVSVERSQNSKGGGG